MCKPIIRLILQLALLLLTTPLGAGQTTVPSLPPAADRPVKKLPVRAPSSAEIEILEFSFQWSYLGYEGPGFTPIEGEPSKGVRYLVEAELYGEDAIATAKFEAIDGRGVFIHRVPILSKSDAYGRPNFFGVMVVPDRPFRLVVSGEGIDGQGYRHTYPRLFRPTARSPEHSRMPKATPDQIRIIKEMTRRALAKIEEDLQKLPDEVIVMPRQRVSNVTYAPFFSGAGRPLGIRVSYDVEFSQDGYFNPELQIFPAYDNEDWRGRVDMRVLNGSITPEPVAAGSPQMQPNILAYGAGYLYKKNTTYHFTVELIPDYAIQNEAKTKFCVYDQKYKHSDQKVREVWAALRASETPTSFKVHINNSDFHGIIENFYALGTFYKSFVAEGAKDCGEQPTNRF